MVVTASRPGRIGNDRAGGGTDRSTRETPYQRARTAADQRTTEYAIFARRLASGECQRHHSKQYNLAHPIPPSRFFDHKKLPAMCVKFAAAHQFTVHELGTFSEVSKSSFHTYMRLLPLTAE